MNDATETEVVVVKKYYVRRALRRVRSLLLAPFRAVGRMIDWVDDRVDTGEVLNACLGSVFTAACSFYAVLFASVGGWYWTLAAPYGVMAVLGLGFTIRALGRLGRKSGEVRSRFSFAGV